MKSFLKEYSVIIACLFTAALLAALCTTSGCSSPLVMVKRVVLVSAGLEKEAIRALGDFDKQYQSRVVENAKVVGDVTKAREELKAYREKREFAVTAINGLWASLLAANTAIVLVEQGQKKDLHAIVATVQEAVVKMKDALLLLGVPLGG